MVDSSPMPDVMPIVWIVVFNGWPILAALVAGAWLVRRGDRGAGFVLWAWALGMSGFVVVTWYVNWVWRLQPGVTQGQWLPVLEVLWFAQRLMTAYALAFLVGIVLFQKGRGR